MSYAVILIRCALQLKMEKSLASRLNRSVTSSNPPRNQALVDNMKPCVSYEHCFTTTLQKGSNDV